MFDTIAAISTPRGEGGIGIVRISGKESLSILCEIFKPKSRRNVSDIKSYTITYGHVFDGEKLVDEVLVSVMKGPYTYTREDIVEINCHGGYIITEKVLELVLKKGAKLAEPGEFTRRAFLNGRLDLTQAESVMDIIHGKTEKSISLSLNQLRGDLKEQIGVLKKLLLDVAAHVNVVLDYPEEGIDEPLPVNLRDNLETVIKTTSRLIASYDKGKMIKEGVKTAIVGKPNVGKSSLLNSVLREERAIVTRIAGTTRDTIEEIVNIKGIPLVMIDTAGIRETEDEVENIGVEKSKSLIKNADLVLFVLDASRELEPEDIEIYNRIESDKVIGILNKIDIERKINIEDLEDEIYEYVVSGQVEDSSEKLVITNVRHKSALEKTKQAVENILETIDMGYPMDLIAVDLNEALDSLSEVTGEISNEDLLDHIFSNFCVGK